MWFLPRKVARTGRHGVRVIGQILQVQGLIIQERRGSMPRNSGWCAEKITSIHVMLAR